MELYIEEPLVSTDSGDGRHTFYGTLLLVLNDVFIAITVLELEVSIEGEDNLVHVDNLLSTSGSVSDLLLYGVEVLVYPRPVGDGKHHVLDDHFSLDSERLVEPKVSPGRFGLRQLDC